MNAQQQRYIEIMQKLAEGSQLLRSEQLWLIELLEPLQAQFFCAKKPGRPADRWHGWMTMDSILSGDPDPVVAQRWNVQGRITMTLKRWRADVQMEFDKSPDRAIWEWAVQNERRRHVSQSPRGDTPKTYKKQK